MIKNSKRARKYRVAVVHYFNVISYYSSTLGVYNPLFVKATTVPVSCFAGHTCKDHIKCHANIFVSFLENRETCLQWNLGIEETCL